MRNGNLQPVNRSLARSIPIALALAGLGLVALYMLPNSPRGVAEDPSYRVVAPAVVHDAEGNYLVFENATSTATPTATRTNTPTPTPRATQSAATATPTETWDVPTPTPAQLPFGLNCLAWGQDDDYFLCIQPPSAAPNIFDAVVVAKSQAALNRYVTLVSVDPQQGTGNTVQRLPNSIGQQHRFAYGADFFRFTPFPAGTYQVSVSAPQNLGESPVRFTVSITVN